MTSVDGKKWCSPCKAWHPREAFGKDCGRYDGLEPKCREARKRAGKRGGETPEEPMRKINELK